MDNIGQPLKFKLEDVTLLDVNMLIDKGVRFSLIPEDQLVEGEYDLIEEVRKNAN